MSETTSTALVGPLPTVTFHDGASSDRGFRRVRVVVDQAPPKHTADGHRWERCTDHRLGCDCREAELGERISELQGLLDEARAAAAEVLAGHRTFPESYRGRVTWGPDGLVVDRAEVDEDAVCQCTGCKIARKAWLR